MTMTPIIAPRLPFEVLCRKKILKLGTRTHIMGILNVTPDSFSDGGCFWDPFRAQDQALVMEAAGADIIDIGGESSRPAGPYGTGAAPISTEEELRRTIPVIKAIAPKINTPISIDTTKAEVARQALDAGADIVNDISALRFDPHMANVVARDRVPVVLMHMQGSPQTMQANPTYDHLIREIEQFFKKQITLATQAGISRSQLIVDPGLGFGKTYAHNIALMLKLPAFSFLNCPILMGPSRKKFTAPDAPPANRLPGTIAALTMCVLSGAHIIRVHDVAAARQAIALTDGLRNAVTEETP